MAYQILDCTLRDGGYYTNWDFDNDLVEDYLSSVARLPIAAVEVGYCNLPQAGYRGEWCYLDPGRLEFVKSRLRADQKLCIMLVAKACQPDDVPRLLKNLDGCVDMVRMPVAPDRLDHGIELARGIKDLGFDVSFNTMYLSRYSDGLEELEPLRMASEHIDVLALVDSYGGCTPDHVRNRVARAIDMFPGVTVGFHGHDNCCLAFANSLAASEAGAAIIDGTFTGMGRGAGNARTEMLIVDNAGHHGELDLEALSMIVERFEEMKRHHRWGTNLPYMLSGSANLPQKDVMDWLGKNRYSPVSVVRALQKRSSDLLDRKTYPPLTPEFADAGNGVLVIGGGSSVDKHCGAIRRFADRHHIPVLHSTMRHLDMLGDVRAAEIVCFPGHAAVHLPDDGAMEKVAGCVVPPPPRFIGTVPGSFSRPVFQAEPFPEPAQDPLAPVSDIGPLALALGAAKALAAERIYLVGFDGYQNASVAEQELGREIQNALDRTRSESEVISLTPTLYDVPTRSIYAEAQVEAR